MAAQTVPIEPDDIYVSPSQIRRFGLRTGGTRDVDCREGSLVRNLAVQDEFGVTGASLQRVVTRDIRHADPEHANQGCKEKQPKPAHQHVLSQIFPISMSALRSTCRSRTR